MSWAAFPGSSTLKQTAVVPDIYYFHGTPVFWLLAEAWDGVDEKGVGVPSTADIPDSVYDAINALPETTPRIFLSHMPTEFFEYSPTSKTTILCVKGLVSALFRAPYVLADRLPHFLIFRPATWRAASIVGISCGTLTQCGTPYSSTTDG